MQILRAKRYEKDLKRLGLSDAEVEAIEAAIAADPAVGDAIPDLKGVRKMRFALEGRGKRGGGWAIYVLILSGELCGMLHAYAKNEKSDLSPADRKALLTAMREIDDE